MALVPLSDAMDTADAFEELLTSHGISISEHADSGADMLPIWKILNRISKGDKVSHERLQEESTAAAAVHDLAAKILNVRNHQDFEMLIPHLELLTKGAVHLTQERQHESADTYNKLIELYWASLLMANDLRIELDHPQHSIGNNPDVIALGDEKSRAYAFKTIRSSHTESIFGHLKKGIDQIERCDADEGVVALHLTPYVLEIDPWPTGGTYYLDWRRPTQIIRTHLSKMIDQVVVDNGQIAVDEVFQGKKAKGAILCLAIFTIVAENPLSGNPVVMPIKIALLKEISSRFKISTAFRKQIQSANEVMQRTL